MPDPAAVARHIELLHAYHLDLWAEVEAQLRVLRAAQEEISKLREARVITETPAEALSTARLLARYVETMKGRVRALSSTVGELEGTVAELVKVLSSE
jgi:hypothetical protein